MKEYLIKTYKKEIKEPEITVVPEKELFKKIDEAKIDELWIAVFEIGECLIDWS